MRLKVCVMVMGLYLICFIQPAWPHTEFQVTNGGTIFLQLLLLVLATKGVITCSTLLLLQEGQKGGPLSCSFKVRPTRNSFPQS